MNLDLTGKVAVITGSTSGIGLGIAKALASQGAHIMLNGLSKSEDAEVIRSGIEKEYKVKALFNGADMTKPEQITALITETKEKFGRLDILVNNAGIQHVAPIDEFPPEKWEQIIAINLVSSFYTIRAAIPMMKEQNWGRIINIASAHAMVASPFKSAYVAAKHGIAGLTKSVALEVAQNDITMNAICPGYVDTPLVRNQIADIARVRNMTEEDVIKNVILGAEPTKKFTTVEQIGEVVLFLCSPSAENITGALLPVDGGWTSQ